MLAAARAYEAYQDRKGDAYDKFPTDAHWQYKGWVRAWYFDGIGFHRRGDQMRLAAISLLGLLLAGCLAGTEAGEPGRRPAECHQPPTCGRNFYVTSTFTDDGKGVYGWNVDINGATDLRDIADGLARTEDGRRFVMFYSEPVYSFQLPPVSITDPESARPADPSFVGLYDYRDNEPFHIVGDG